MPLTTEDGRVAVRFTRTTLKVRVKDARGGIGICGQPWIEFDLRELLEDANITTADAERLLAGVTRLQTHEVHVRGQFRSAFLGKRRKRFIEVHGRRCHYCGRKGDERVGPDGNPWHIDHVMPVSRGGDNSPQNLVLACAKCNCRKSDRIA